MIDYDAETFKRKYTVEDKMSDETLTVKKESVLRAGEDSVEAEKILAKVFPGVFEGNEWKPISSELYLFCPYSGVFYLGWKSDDGKKYNPFYIELRDLKKWGGSEFFDLYEARFEGGIIHVRKK